MLFFVLQISYRFDKISTSARIYAIVTLGRKKYGRKALKGEVFLIELTFLVPVVVH